MTGPQVSFHKSLEESEVMLGQGETQTKFRWKVQHGKEESLKNQILESKYLIYLTKD